MNVDASPSPAELFKKCEEKAKGIELESYRWAPNVFVEGLTFWRIFEPELEVETQKHRLDVGMLHRNASRYDYLVQILRDSKDNDERWQILAAWLKQEEICTPEDFLPPRIFKRLTKPLQTKLKRFSPTNHYYFALVEAWRPYFEKLLADYRMIRDHKRKSKPSRKPRVIIPTEALTDAGYEESAVKVVVSDRKRTAVAAVCWWLAVREHCDAFTMRNAHSLVSVGSFPPPKRRK
jgi:hypothetical protein